MLPRHALGDGLGGVDDLIKWDDLIEPGQRHVRAGKRVGGGEDVLAEARGLDAIGDGVTDEPQHGLQRQGSGGAGLLRRPPIKSTNAAAPIAAAEPPSAWQPPTSAAKVQRVAMKAPMTPLASKAFAVVISSSPRSSATASTTLGKAAQAPAVGIATMTPMLLFTSMRAVTYRIARFKGPAAIKRSACIACAKAGDWLPSTRSA